MPDKIELKIKFPVPKGMKQLGEFIRILQRTLGFFRTLLEKSKIT